MSKSKINYRVYNGRTLKNFIENIRIYVISALFSIGIVIGAISMKNSGIIYDNLKSYIENYMVIKAGQGISDIFLNSVISNLLLMILNIFLSFSLIGYPIIIWIPFLKGLGIGSVCGYMYTVYKFSGVGYCFLTVFPGAIVSTYALICACNFGCDYSKNAYMKAIANKGQFENDETKIFIIRQIVLIIICAVSSAIDALFSYVFLRFFDF